MLARRPGAGTRQCTDCVPTYGEQALHADPARLNRDLKVHLCAYTSPF